MDVKTWADLAALNQEALDAYTPEDLEALKTSITEHEAALVKEHDEALKKANELADNYKIRAEKAEKEAKEEKSDIASKDILYLAKADIHEDDLNDVLEWAKFKNISVHEAHKQLKGTLDVRAEERKTAEAANTKSTRSSSAVTGEKLLERALQNELPEKDEDIERLAEARINARRKE